jgi:hypothetical protein
VTFTRGRTGWSSTDDAAASMRANSVAKNGGSWRAASAAVTAASRRAASSISPQPASVAMAAGSMPTSSSMGGFGSMRSGYGHRVARPAIVPSC